jgi:hypothetical protein
VSYGDTAYFCYAVGGISCSSATPSRAFPGKVHGVFECALVFKGLGILKTVSFSKLLQGSSCHSLKKENNREHNMEVYKPVEGSHRAH